MVEPGQHETLFGGTIHIWPEGDFSYQPPALFHGTDSLIYGITDGDHSVAGGVISNVTD